MAIADFRRQLEGFGLTTANILYRMPDHPDILQNYIWQQHDLHPHFPELKKFLDFWTRELDGLLYSVTVAHARLIKPAEFKAVGAEFRLNRRCGRGNDRRRPRRPGSGSSARSGRSDPAAMWLEVRRSAQPKR
jgi:uncharacterized protein Usg